MAPLIQTLGVAAGFASCVGFQVPSDDQDGVLFLSKTNGGYFIQDSALDRERHREPRDDYNDETELHEVAPVIWPEESPLPVTVEILIALLWASLISSIPLVIARLDAKPITTTGKVMAGLLWAAILGGLYLFTNIIVFQSVHFATVRPLTIVECVYLMSQVISTVGYGDITPAKPRGRVFVALYVLAALFVIAMLVSQIVDHLKTKVAQDKKDGSGASASDDGEAVVAKLQEGAKAADVHSAPPLTPLFRAAAIYCSVASIWVLFFHFYPGEGKTWLEAAYMSLITLSTVGFGAFTPVTEGGKVFAAFFFLLGPVLLGNVVGEFGTFFLKWNHHELRVADETTHEMRVQEFLDKVRNGEVSEVDFIRWGLHQQDLVPDEELEELRVAWKMMENAAHEGEELGDVMSNLSTPRMPKRDAISAGMLSSLSTPRMSSLAEK